MVVFCLGYFVGSYVTKAVRAFLDPRPPTPPRFDYPRPALHKRELEEPVPIPRTHGRHRHNSWPPQNPPNRAVVPPVQGVVTSQETQQAQQMHEAVRLLRLHRRPPKGREPPLLKQLKTGKVSDLMQNGYVLAGAAFLGIVVIPYSRARLFGGSFPQEAGSATVSYVTQAGILAAASKALGGFSAACSVAHAGIAAGFSMMQHTCQGIMQAVELITGTALLMVFFITYLIIFVFTNTDTDRLRSGSTI